MADFRVRPNDESAARLDEGASGLSGRSARLRQRKEQDSSSAPKSSRGATGPNKFVIQVRLTRQDTAAVDAEAAAMNLSRAGWVTGLIRRRLRTAPTFERPDEVSLIAIHSELQRMRINVSEIARVLKTSVPAGLALDRDLASIAELQRDLRHHMVAVRQAFAGNLAYWDAGP